MTTPIVMLRLALASLVIWPPVSTVPIASSRVAVSPAVQGWKFVGMRRAKLDGMPLLTFEPGDRMPRVEGRRTVPIPLLLDRSGMFGPTR